MRRRVLDFIVIGMLIGMSLLSQRENVGKPFLINKRLHTNQGTDAAQRHVAKP